MSLIFPKNNLPEASQPWAREIQKQVYNVVSSSTSDEINNAARDNQLNSSVLSLAAVVNDVKSTAQTATEAAAAANQAAIDALAAAQAAQNAIDAANNAQFDASVALNELSDLESGTGTFTINAGSITGGNVRGGVLELTSGSNSYITLYNGGVDIQGPGGTFSVGASGNTGITSDGLFTMLGLGAAASTTPNMRHGTGSGQLNQVVIIGGSTRDIKNSIKPIDEISELDPKKLLDVSVRAFKYNNDYLHEQDCRFDTHIPGFIAEELQEIYPIAVDKADGKPEDWNARYVVPGMLALIQDLYKRIEVLENKNEVQ